MTLHVCRQPPCDGAILGRLAVNGVFECYTLEGVSTEIPAATYGLAITFSQRFQRDMPEILGVSGRTGIRLHPGNVMADTHGCLLVGRTHDLASVQDSRAAFDDLVAVLQSATDPITITIEDPPAETRAA